MLMVGVMVVITVLGLTGVSAAAYLTAVHHVRAAADLAALSGAVAIGQGRDGCAAATANAHRNGASVASCDQVGDAVDFVISVQARVGVEGLFPGLPQTVSAWAHAGPAR